ncbi:hypothetical protein ACMFMF_008336 [Clarireedia jacksonii]
MCGFMKRVVMHWDGVLDIRCIILHMKGSLLEIFTVSFIYPDQQPQVPESSLSFPQALALGAIKLPLAFRSPQTITPSHPLLSKENISPAPHVRRPNLLNSSASP